MISKSSLGGVSARGESNSYVILELFFLLGDNSPCMVALSKRALKDTYILLGYTSDERIETRRPDSSYSDKVEVKRHQHRASVC